MRWRSAVKPVLKQGLLSANLETFGRELVCGRAENLGTGQTMVRRLFTCAKEFPLDP